MVTFFLVQRLSAHQYSQNLHKYRGSQPRFNLTFMFRFNLPHPLNLSLRDGLALSTSPSVCKSRVQEKRDTTVVYLLSAHSNRHHQVFFRCCRLESSENDYYKLSTRPRYEENQILCTSAFFQNVFHIPRNPDKLLYFYSNTIILGHHLRDGLLLLQRVNS